MGTLRLGLSLSGSDTDPARLSALGRAAEEAGFDSVWTGESWGSDAVAPLAWIAGQTQRIRLGTDIMQMPGRSPALTANTAATLDALSGGRMILGLGVSGPQVVEGWHGLPYGKPLVRTREYVEIVRTVLRREAPLEFHGEHYDIPYRGPGATGLGKPLKSILHPRADIPIYLAALGPKNVALATRIADGLLPIWWNAVHWRKAFGDSLRDADFSRFDVAPLVNVVMGDDLEACRDAIRPKLALYVGGMGARGKNFYNDLACKYGYEAAALHVQDLYLDGKKREAEAAIPVELIDEVALVGPREHIADQLAAWRESPVTTLILTTGDVDVMRAIAELVG